MRSELPIGMAALVGRGHERAEVARLVAGTRVVTLTGSGGCGKTRLAAEVARDVAPRFRDGTCWVDLQGASEPGLVAQVVGGTADVHERPGQPLVDTLREALRTQQLLLVLDNCEHLAEACAALVSELSSACPRLHVLATSRVPLVVAGEATYAVAGLPMPPADDYSAGAVAAADAARLFEVRARLVASDFRIRADNASAVAAICRHLDGIPLAIELAAARTRVLAPEQIAAGLSDRFALLTGGARGGPARQRTLEASLDWSHDLLDDRQKLALARLSVFAGSFELDAAESVVSGPGIDRGDVLDLVAGLVEQSLVQVVHRPGRARYRLLETIRMYARQRLSELDDPAAVSGRHLDFHVELAGRAQAGLDGARPESWVARLGDDLDDLRAAMDWAARTGDLSGLVGVTEPIVRYWLERGLSREVQRRLHDAARAPDTPANVRVRALNTAAALGLATYEPAAIHRSATTAVHAARAAGGDGPLALALAHRALSGILSGRSTVEQVTADTAEALEHARRCGDVSTRAHVLQFAGAALLHGRSIDAGYGLYEECVEVCEAGDLAFHLPAAHGGAQAWLPWSGRLEQAAWHARRTIGISRGLGRPGWEAVGLIGLAACSVLRGEHAKARTRLSQAAAVLRPRGLDTTHYGMWLRHWRALSAHASGDPDGARSAADEIVRIARAGGSRLDEAVGEWLRGLVAQAQQHGALARKHFEAGIELSTGPRLPHTLGRSLLGLADVARGDEDLEAAWGRAHEGLEVLHAYGDRVGAATALELVADLAAARDDPERSLRLLGAAQRFHDDTGIVRFALTADRCSRAREAAHAMLDPADATACWAAGHDLSMVEAVGYALRGRGARGRPRIGWASLTPTESDIVRLVAEGHTNAEVGRRLFISPNTVKKHLSRVYAKVDVSGRADLSAEYARRDLA